MPHQAISTGKDCPQAEMDRLPWFEEKNRTTTNSRNFHIQIADNLPIL
jgi:hypothetical protein